MKRYVATFYRHWWLYLPILILLLAGTAVGTNAVVRKAAKYQSATRIWVSEPPLQEALGQTQTYQQITPAQARNDMLFQLIQTDSFIRNILKGTPIEQQLTGDLDHDEPTILKVRAGVRIEVLGANSVLITYTDTSPELAQSVLQNILSEFRNWLLASNLEQSSAEKTYYQDQASSYQQQVDQARKDLDAFTAQHPSIKSDDLASQAQLQRLQAQFQAAQQTYTAAQSKLQEAEVVNNLSSASADGSTFRTLDAPTRPGKPASVLKKALKYGGMGIGGSFAFVLAAIFVLTWMDKNVWTSEEVLACCQTPVLEVVPHLKRRKERRDDANATAQQKPGPSSEAVLPRPTVS